MSDTNTLVAIGVAALIVTFIAVVHAIRDEKKVEVAPAKKKGRPRGSKNKKR